MYKINGISDAPYQEFTVGVPNTDEQVKITLRYMPTQRAWYMDFLYKNYEEKSIKLVLSPNLLRSYKKILPFGLSVVSINDMHPMNIDSFTAENNTLYILDKDFVDSLENELYGE